MRFLQRRQNQRFIHRQIRECSLNYLFWECTLRCNLSCLHCGSDCKYDSEKVDMPLNDFLNAVTPAAESEGRDKIMVVLTGGEPLLRNDIVEIGLSLRKAGFRWGMVSNGMQYTEEMQSKLLAAGMGSITISLDGMEEKHNEFRGHKNSFERAVNAIKMISGASRLNSDVVTCVHENNIEELEDLYQLLISIKAKSWRLFTISPIGRAKLYDYMNLSPTSLKRLMEFIAEKRKSKNIKISFSCEAYVGAYEYKVRDAAFFCRAGINIASVLADGSIAACPNISKTYVQGNIYEDDFFSVWNNAYQAYRDSKLKRRGRCAECQDFKKCRGGAMHLRDENLGNFYCHQKLLKSSSNR